MSVRPSCPSIRQHRRSALSRGVAVIALLLAAATLGGCVVAPYPGYYAYGPGYYRPYPHYYYR